MGTLEQKKLNKEKRDLLQSIDRGIDDMKAEREISVREAYQKITEIRNERTPTTARSCYDMGSDI